MTSIWYCRAAVPADPPGTMRPNELLAICEVAMRYQSWTCSTTRYSHHTQNRLAAMAPAMAANHQASMSRRSGSAENTSHRVGQTTYRPTAARARKMR